MRREEQKIGYGGIVGCSEPASRQGPDLQRKLTTIFILSFL